MDPRSTQRGTSSATTSRSRSTPRRDSRARSSRRRGRRCIGFRRCRGTRPGQARLGPGERARQPEPAGLEHVSRLMKSASATRSPRPGGQPQAGLEVHTQLGASAAAAPPARLRLGHEARPSPGVGPALPWARASASSMSASAARTPWMPRAPAHGPAAPVLAGTAPPPRSPPGRRARSRPRPPSGPSPPGPRAASRAPRGRAPRRVGVHRHRLRLVAEQVGGPAVVGHGQRLGQRAATHSWARSLANS